MSPLSTPLLLPGLAVVWEGLPGAFGTAADAGPAVGEGTLPAVGCGMMLPRGRRRRHHVTSLPTCKEEETKT